MEKPTLKQRFTSCGTFLYNPESGHVLGRSGRSWAEIGLFYVIYYACLAAFFAATLAVFNQTLDNDSPKLQGSDSLLKGNPGMGFQPMPDIDTTLIYSTKEGREKYAESIEKVLKAYKDATDGEDCSTFKGLREDAKEPCSVDYAALTKECNSGNSFGMLHNEPCVLLKLNRIFSWKPELWTKAEIQEEERISDDIKTKYTDDRIWVDCRGENPADSDNLRKATVTYYPQQGFPLAYYPFTKQKGYMSPLVFVKFANMTQHLAFMIECQALAKNIAVDRTEKEGSVHFELLID